MHFYFHFHFISTFTFILLLLYYRRNDGNPSGFMMPIPNASGEGMFHVPFAWKITWKSAVPEWPDLGSVKLRWPDIASKLPCPFSGHSDVCDAKWKSTWFTQVISPWDTTFPRPSGIPCAVTSGTSIERTLRCHYPGLDLGGGGGGYIFPLIFTSSSRIRDFPWHHIPFVRGYWGAYIANICPLQRSLKDA